MAPPDVRPFSPARPARTFESRRISPSSEGRQQGTCAARFPTVSLPPGRSREASLVGPRHGPCSQRIAAGIDGSDQHRQPHRRCKAEVRWPHRNDRGHGRQRQDRRHAQTGCDRGPRWQRCHPWSRWERHRVCRNRTRHAHRCSGRRQALWRTGERPHLRREGLGRLPTGSWSGTTPEV